VPWAASRYIAAHDDRCRRHFASPPPFRENGARLILFVPPETGSAACFPLETLRGGCPDPVVLMD
jgi:hypothetical protein